MATHSSILAWKIPWTEEPGGLQSIGLQSQTQPFGCAEHSLQRTEAEDMEGMTRTGIDALPLPQTCCSPWNFDIFSGTGRGWRADRSR